MCTAGLLVVCNCNLRPFFVFFRGQWLCTTVVGFCGVGLPLGSVVNKKKTGKAGAMHQQFFVHNSVVAVGERAKLEGTGRGGKELACVFVHAQMI